MVGPAGKTAIFLVAQPQREQCRLLELDLVVPLRPVLGLGQQLGQADHLQRPLAQVVRLLGVEQQDPVGDLDIGHHDGDDGAGAESPERGQAVVAVGGPVRVQGGLPFPSLLAGLGATHNDHRIQIPAELVHGRGQPLDVGLGEIALEGCGLHQVDRQGREDLPVAAERVLVGGQDGAAVGFDGLSQASHGCGPGARTDGVGSDAAGAGLGRRFLLSPWLPLALARGTLGGLRLGHWNLVSSLRGM